MRTCHRAGHKRDVGTLLERNDWASVRRIPSTFILQYSLDSNLRAGRMSAVLNGKIIFEANPAGWSHTRGYEDGCRRRRRGNSDPQRQISILFCTSVVTGAPQRHRDSGAYRGLAYCSSVSGPASGLGSRSDERGVAVRIVSYSVTTTTPGTGSSITSMIVSSTGTSTTCLGAFLGAFLAAIFDGRWFLGHGFRGTPDRTPDLGLCLFRRRTLCGLLARRLGAGLATFRAFLARRNALLCFGHDCPL